MSLAAATLGEHTQALLL